MKPIPQTILVRAGNLSCFLVMAVSGWTLSGTPQPPVAAGDDTGRSHKRSIRPQRAVSGPGGDARKSLDAIRGAGTPEDRLRATIALANALPPSEFAAWLGGGWFNLSGGGDQLVFTRIIQERWMREDPEGMVQFSLKNKSSDAGGILATWAERDPRRVIEFFIAHPDDRLELDALWGMAKTDPGLALLRFQELAKAGLSPKAMQESDRLLRQLANKSPAALRASLDSLPSSVKKSAEAYLLGLDLSASFSKEIRKLWDRPDGWSALIHISLNVKGFQANLFGELANLPPAWKESFAANSYIMFDESITAKLLDADLIGDGFTAAQANRIRMTALKRIVTSQPEAGLKQMAEMNLDAASRELVIRNAFTTLRADSEAAGELMGLLGSEEDRQAAVKAMAMGIDRQSQLNQLMGKPDGLMQQVTTGDFSSGGIYRLFVPKGPWDRQTNIEMRAKFDSLPIENKPQVAQLIARSDESAGIDPVLTGEAIRYLIDHPEDDPDGGDKFDPLRMASEYAAKLVIKDPAAASGWVQSLPAGDAKLWAQKNLARNWAQYDPRAVDDWILTLPPDALAEVRDFMKKKR
jgi:hypothetical protein